MMISILTQLLSSKGIEPGHFHFHETASLNYFH